MSDQPTKKEEDPKPVDYHESDDSFEIRVSDGPTSILNVDDPDVQILNLDDVDIDEDDLADIDGPDDNADGDDEYDALEQYGIDEEDDEDGRGGYIMDDLDELPDEEHGELEPITDDAILTYRGHTDSVYCVAVDPVHKLFVTGGGDDEAHVVSLTSGETKYKCTGNTDSVIYVGFSFKYEYLLVAAMDGRMAIYEPETGELLQEFHTETDVDVVLWHPTRNIFAIGCGDGVVWIYDADSQLSNAYYGQQDAVTTVQFSRDGTQLISASQDQSLIIRELAPNRESSRIKYSYFGNGEATVISLSTHPTLNDLVVGLSDGGVFTCQSKSEKVQLSLKQAHQDGVESVAFGTALIPSIFSASVDGTVKSWDPARGANRFTLSHPDAVTKLAVHPSKPILVTGCQDGVIRLFNMRTGAQIKELSGHRDGILDMVVTKDLIMTASDDKTAKVFSIADIKA